MSRSAEMRRPKHVARNSVRERNPCRALPILVPTVRSPVVFRGREAKHATLAIITQECGRCSVTPIPHSAHLGPIISPSITIRISLRPAPAGNVFYEQALQRKKNCRPHSSRELGSRRNTFQGDTPPSLSRRFCSIRTTPRQFSDHKIVQLLHHIRSATHVALQHHVFAYNVRGARLHGKTHRQREIQYNNSTHTPRPWSRFPTKSIRRTH